ncbi:hypothetical protein [Streptosporangium sp. CA-115845]|uniref:hypothetical protein n=1 Tax=Streptosporangium sp. CA-115845 TaxID=3240071 RepID=UPI003D8D1709
MGNVSRTVLADIAIAGAELDESRLLGISGGQRTAEPHSWTSADGGSVIDDIV